MNRYSRKPVIEKRSQDDSYKEISRRSMLKTVAMGALAAGGGIALNMAVPGTAEAIVRKLPETWDETWDVIVVGSGFAGLAAAAEAAGAGAKVVILEKMPTYGGNSIINGGEYNAWDDEFHLRQKLNLGDDSVELHTKDTLKGGDYYGFPDLVKIFTEQAEPTLNWMIDDGGLKLRQVVNRTGGHSAYRTHTCVEGVGRGYTEALKKIAEGRGAKLVLNSNVTWIWRADADPQSPVLGVEVKRGRRTLNLRSTRALVLATGGFSANKDRRKLYNPSIVSDFNTTNHPGATGEVHHYAQAVGAEAIQMAFIQLYPYAEPETGLLDAPAVYPFRGPGFGIVYVNKAGKRFVNEMERRDVVSRAEIATGMKPTFTIFNEKMIPRMGTKEEVEAGVARGRFVRADTLAELAGKLGIPADALQDTIAKHNQYMKDGKDPEFNRAFTKAMLPLDEGPFYGIAQWPAVHFCMGGLRINEQAQVLDIWMKPIPRLYAAGEVSGGIHGDNRLGGNATASCTVYGRIAGLNAAKEKPLA